MMITLDSGITSDRELDEKLLENHKRFLNGEISEEECNRISSELIDEDNKKRNEKLKKIVADAKAHGVILPEGLEEL